MNLNLGEWLRFQDPSSSPPFHLLDWKTLLMLIPATAICTVLVWDAPFFGSDWVYHFALEGDSIYLQYPPWLPLMLAPLTWLPPRAGLAVINGLTLSTAAILTYRTASLSFPKERLSTFLAVIFSLLNTACQKFPKQVWMQHSHHEQGSNDG